MNRNGGTIVVCSVLIIAAKAIFATAGFGQETLLAWKFRQGDTFKVTRQQQSISHTSVANKPVRTSVATGISMTWHVDEVKANGEAIVSQTLDRITTKMDAGNGVVEFDSDEGAKPTGVVKTLAEGVLPLVGGKFLATITPRGEIVHVELSEKLAAASSAAVKTQGSLSAEGILKLLKQPVLLLPEKEIAPGNHWQIGRDLPSALGTLKQTLDLEFAGFGEEEHAKIVTIKITGGIAPPARVANAPKLKSNELTGTAQFDTENGRLVELTLKQTIELTSVFSNMPLSAKTESTVTTKFSK